MDAAGTTYTHRLIDDMVGLAVKVSKPTRSHSKNSDWTTAIGAEITS